MIIQILHSINEKGLISIIMNTFDFKIYSQILLDLKSILDIYLQVDVQMLLVTFMAYVRMTIKTLTDILVNVPHPVTPC